ncbi:MAG TPA: hypothetical protein VH134_08625 [Candidatus Dormibacteraeota bacterium]|jgi:hypothetical protein|nr:hypothetical protein [Candidatus Dormibacteraeota bacterium]
MATSTDDPGHLARRRHGWQFIAAAPPREVFSVFEQMVGTPPFRYEVTGPDSARALEVERLGLFGQWSKRVRRPRWVTCTAREVSAGTEVSVEASAGRGAVPRGLQLVQLLSRGNRDRRTIYRDRHFPDGPVTLVASWAGTPYLLFTEPRRDATRSEAVHTATPLFSFGHEGAFVHVRTDRGVTGWIERDEIVPAPPVATREAQEITAHFG